MTMKDLNKTVLDIRERQRIKPYATDRPAASWTGKDLVDGEIIDSLTIIFRTSGCYWGCAGGCTMCGYVYDSATEIPDDDDLDSQLEHALKKASDLEKMVVKIFTSGSFLDENEISRNSRKNILLQLRDDDRIVKVIVETRPEFVTDQTMNDCMDLIAGKPFEIAVGLETSSDKIRSESINKGFSFKDFVRASEIAKTRGITTKAYLLLKPPFISESMAVDDIIRSVNDIHPYAGTVSINLCNVQKGTLVEMLWERKQFRPPWLWSIVEILKKTKSTHPDLVIMSDPVGAGSQRGPHNCKICSRDVADAVRNFSLTQDIRVLDSVSCECRYLWGKIIELDDYTYGAPITV